MSFLKCFVFNLFILAYSISLYAAEPQNNNVPTNTPSSNTSSMPASKPNVSKVPKAENDVTNQNKQINPTVPTANTKSTTEVKKTKVSKSNKSKLALAEEELDEKIDTNYSFLEDLNLGLNDPIPLKGDPSNYVVIYLEKKPLLIELFPDKAPKTVSVFKRLVKSGFYNDTDFFRLVPNYIIQGGDPTSSGYGGTGHIRDAEISPDLKFQRGSIAMANSGNLHSDDSQFFISFESFPWLDGKYTIFGKVISGMAFLETFQSNFTNDGFLPETIIIERVVLASDLPKSLLVMQGKNSLSVTNLIDKKNDQPVTPAGKDNKDQQNTNKVSPNVQSSNKASATVNTSKNPNKTDGVASASSTITKTTNTTPTTSPKEVVNSPK